MSAGKQSAVKKSLSGKVNNVASSNDGNTHAVPDAESCDWVQCVNNGETEHSDPLYVSG